MKTPTALLDVWGRARPCQLPVPTPQRLTTLHQGLMATLAVSTSCSIMQLRRTQTLKAYSANLFKILRTQELRAGCASAWCTQSTWTSSRWIIQPSRAPALKP